MRLFFATAFLCLVACGDKDGDSGSTDGADGASDGADGASDGADGGADGADGGADGADGGADGADGADGSDGADGTDGGDTTAGAAIFSSICAECHGADGASGSGADLTVRVPALTDEEITTVVLNGQGYMPAQDLDPTQVADVVAYLRATFGG